MISIDERFENIGIIADMAKSGQEVIEEVIRGLFGDDTEDEGKDD